jgi:hypothetical protein
MLKQFDNCTGPGGGTQRLHHKHTENVQSVSKSIKGRNLEQQCVFDGDEIGRHDRMYQKMGVKRLKNGCWWDSMGNECLESCADSIFSAVR